MGEFLLTFSIIALVITFCYVYIKEKLNPLNYGEAKRLSTQAANEKESYYNTRYISDSGEIFRFLRYRRTPPKEDIRPKKLSFDENMNVNYFGELENNKNPSNNRRKNSVENKGYLSDYNSSNTRNESKQRNRQRDYLLSKSRINNQRLWNNKLIEDADLRKELHINNNKNYNFESFGKRSLNTNDLMRSSRLDSELLYHNPNNNININYENNFPQENILNQHKSNFVFYNEAKNLCKDKIAEKGFIENRSRRTLDDNYLRRHNFLRENSKFPSSVNNDFYLRNPENTIANPNSYEYMNRNLQSNRNFISQNYLEYPDKTRHFGLSNNIPNAQFDYNNNNTNHREFGNRFDYAYVNDNIRNNFESNTKSNKYLIKNDQREYLEATASQIKQNNKLNDEVKIKITPVTVNKFYSINNINITNTNKNNKPSGNNELGIMSRNRRGVSLDNQILSHKSRNNFNDFYALQQENFKNLNAENNQAQNKDNNKDSYLKQFPIRKLDFDESNFKFNHDMNLRPSDNKNFRRNDAINFSEMKFQSCKSKLE